MSGGRSAGGRLRAASTAAVNAFAWSAGRLANQAASISFVRAVSAARRSDSNFECFVTAFLSFFRNVAGGRSNRLEVGI
jgi:hypothetical protein